VRLPLELLLAAALVLAPLAGSAQPEELVEAGETPRRVDVRKALDKVANDPNLAAERTIDMLRWKQPEPVADEPSWWQWANAIVHWFRGFFAWVAASGRFVVWVLGALAAALLALYVVRLVRTRGLPRVPKPLGAPSHVRDLDIRPESLPDDVGSAALVLWQRGEERAALALLYRGLLSRLVHAYAVPIRASSTEGECLALARPHLAEASAGYAARLVGTWGAAVYGGLLPARGAVQSLCDEFAAALDRKGRP
jgi:hypothetical protein